MVNTAASTRLGAGWCLDTDLESSDDPGVGGSGLGDSELGGKATGLVELVRHGAPVPRFAVVLGSTFRTRARPALAGVLGGFVYDLADADADAGAVAGSDAGSVAEVIERWSPTLVAAVESIPDDDLAAIVGPGGMLAALGSGDAPLAVRSSMVGEDSATASFAGQLRSFIGVAAEPRAIAAAIRGCWASAFSVHALAYAHRSGLDPAALRVAVVVQVCVEADRSGVAFSADPRSGRRDLTVISATHGVGEGVVGGLVDGDEYRVAADGGVDATTGTACEAARSAADGLVAVVPLAEAARGRTVLTGPEVATIDGWMRRLSEAAGRPLDVEFSFDAAGVLHLLQARPITAMAAPPQHGTPWLWDDANIQESFCGVTLPLTFSFASRAYTTVYRNLGRLLGVGDRVERDHADMLRTMIGLIDGRVYYNLNAWFEGLALLPSSGTNKADMEAMMGVEEPVPFVVDQRSTPVGTATMVASLLPAAARLAPQYLRIDEGIAAFDARLAALEASVDFATLRDASIGECLAVEVRVWRELLEQWQVPIINDIRVMRATGGLRRLIESATPDDARRSRLEVELLAAIDGLASVEPTLELMRIAALIRADADAARALATPGDPQATLDAVIALLPEVGRRIDAYIAAYGGRVMGELKLETVTLRRDPTFLVDVVRAYAARDDLDPDGLARRDRIRHEAAVEELIELVGPRRRARAERAVRSARSAIAAREHLRLGRTRVFDVVRELYTTIGERLAEASVLQSPRDVFLLTADEVRGFHEGTAVTTDLAALVEVRRAEFARFVDRSPAHRLETRGSVHLCGPFDAPAEAVDPEAVTWSGLGCCPGVVEAEVVVVHDPSSAPEVAGRIVVAVRTDPGWAPLFPAAAGLIVERGSALSHSAVIAREVGLPTVVGVPGVVAALRSGDRVRLDGAAGTVARLDVTPGDTESDGAP